MLAGKMLGKKNILCVFFPSVSWHHVQLKLDKALESEFLLTGAKTSKLTRSEWIAEGQKLRKQKRFPEGTKPPWRQVRVSHLSIWIFRALPVWWRSASIASTGNSCIAYRIFQGCWKLRKALGKEIGDELHTFFTLLSICLSLVFVFQLC